MLRHPPARRATTLRSDVAVWSIAVASLVVTASAAVQLVTVAPAAWAVAGLFVGAFLATVALALE